MRVHGEVTEGVVAVDVGGIRAETIPLGSDGSKASRHVPVVAAMW